MKLVVSMIPIIRSVANALETPKEREYRLLARQKRTMDNR